MSVPDYESYTLDELEDVLNNIDYEKYPERVQLIRDILNDPEKNYSLHLEHNEEISETNPFDYESEEEVDPKSTGTYLFIMAFVLLVTGTLYTDFGSIQIESWTVRIIIFVIIMAIAITLLLHKDSKSK